MLIMSSQILCFGCGSRGSDKTVFEEFTDRSWNAYYLL